MKIKLDHLGQYYAAVNNENNPGTFSVGVHLNEPLQPRVLQRAVNDMTKRLPHMNVQRYTGFFHYYHLLRTKPLCIEKENQQQEPCRYFEKNKSLLRVIYGNDYFTLEVLHTVCDGRSLAMAACSLLIRYYELLGINVNKRGFVDCNGKRRREEITDAYAQQADMRKTQSIKNEDAYIPLYKTAKTKVITHTYDLKILKQKAKKMGVTITEYILACIFMAFARQRAKEGVQKGIACSVPIDCRGFFPCKSLRCFVTHKIVGMTESAKMNDIIQGIKKQFAEINPDYIQEKISEMEYLIQLGCYVPLFIKKWIIKSIGKSATVGCSTGFSNLGFVELPVEIQNKVDKLTFVLGAEPNIPYLFACVATGNVLTLTATTTAKNNKIVERIDKMINGMLYV